MSKVVRSGAISHRGTMHAFYNALKTTLICLFKLSVNKIMARFSDGKFNNTDIFVIRKLSKTKADESLTYHNNVYELTPGAF